MLLIQHGTLHTMEAADPIRADLLIREELFRAQQYLEITSSVCMTVINGKVVWLPK